MAKVHEEDSDSCHMHQEMDKKEDRLHHHGKRKRILEIIFDMKTCNIWYVC